MKMCLEHWDRLRDGLKERKMFHLVATDGHKLFDRFKKEREGQATIPDPLMESHNMILGRALKYMPHVLGLNEKNPEGHYCPLCEARIHMPPHPETNQPCDDSWIITLLDYLKVEYTKEGWLNEN